MEDRRLIKMRRRVRRGVEIPVEDPGIQKRIAEVGGAGREARGKRPREHDREHEKESEDRELANDFRH